MAMSFKLMFFTVYKELHVLEESNVMSPNDSFANVMLWLLWRESEDRMQLIMK